MLEAERENFLLEDSLPLHLLLDSTRRHSCKLHSFLADLRWVFCSSNGIARGRRQRVLGGS